MTDQALLVNLILALAVAVLGAALAVRLRQPVLVGYIIGGILIGPYTPGFVGDPTAVNAMAEIGVILLMFTIGVQLDLRELLHLGRLSLFGGLAQVIALIAIGYGVGTALGWSGIEALFFGAFISNSSSTVLSKVFSERGELGTPHFNLALAWSSVQDFSTVALVVILSALATGGGGLGMTMFLAMGRALLFIVVLVVVGVKVFPWFLDRLASLHSRELFVLATAALALGAAYVSTFFGLSLALGAFAAGIIVGESDLSHRILGEVTPLRDIFAGMFFVSIGMLANPGYVISNPGIVLVALALIVLVKSTLSAAITLLAKVRTRTGLLAGASLGQSAEFSFVLAQVGAGLGVVGSDLFTLMVTAAAGSIVAVPYLVGVASKLSARSESALVPDPELASSANALRDHAVICGFGRVGRVIGEGLAEDGYPFLVIDQDQSVIRELREQGTPAIAGPAESAAVLEHAGLANARVVVVALPDALAVRQVVDYCHRLYPDLPIVARTHSDRELEYLQGRGITAAVMGERELAAEMARCTLRCLISEPETDHQERATQPEAPAGD